jgi:hypothetical protein
MTKIKDRTEELQEAAWAAARKRRDLESQRDGERRKAIQEFELKLDKEVIEPKFGEKIRQARTKEREAELALKVEQDRVALASVSKAPWPIGTRFVEWERSFSRGPFQKRKKKHEEVAVLEVFTSQSAKPSNFSDYKKPLIGAYVLRVLKKDGTPSARYIQGSYSWSEPRTFSFGRWHPEGVDPNKEDA